MFTLKFYNNYENEQTTETVICCPHYSIYTRSEGNYSVDVYPQFVKKGGVNRDVSVEESHFDFCYIENEAGKTINVLRASS